MGKTPAFLLLSAVVTLPVTWALASDDARTIVRAESGIRQALTQRNPDFAEPSCLRRVARTGDHRTLVSQGYRISEVATEPAWDFQGRRYYRITLTYQRSKAAGPVKQVSSAESYNRDDEARVFTSLRCRSSEHGRGGAF